MKGKFITIEGTEGAGKSTAIQFVYDYLSKAQKEIILTREPGGTPYAEKIRDLLLHEVTGEAVSNAAELLLMFASRAQHIHQLIEPSLRTGKWVVSDRYIDATYAYQGGGRKFDIEQIKTLDNLIVDKLYPDLTLLLDIPAEQGFARAEKRGGERDRIEQEKIDFFERVRDTYLARAKADPNRIKIIDASLDISLVQAQIKSALDSFLADK